MEQHVSKCRAPPQEDLYFMYKKVLTDPFRNAQPIVDLRPTSSSLSKISSDTVFDWPKKEKFEIPYVEPTKLHAIGYGFHDQKTRRQNMVDRLNQFHGESEACQNKPLKLPSIVRVLLT